MAYISVFHLIPAHIMICVRKRKEKGKELHQTNLIQEGANED